MSESMTAEAATALRRPFPEESVGKLPKGGQMLDYVGHAAVTDRLLSVDPYWSWEPFAVTAHGLPALDGSNNLWIRLTVCGVTRIGVGDGKSAKEAIGDAIRNAAMRFGVALDLWAKENLVEFAQQAATASRRQADAEADTGEIISPQTLDRMLELFTLKGVPDDQRLVGINRICDGTSYDAFDELTERDALRVVRSLQQRPTPAPADADAGASTDADPGEDGGEAPSPGPAPRATTNPPAGPITRPQERMILARLPELGVPSNDREERLAVLTGLVGREITSTSKLSKAEATQVIDLLGKLRDRAALNAHLDQLDADRAAQP